MSDTPKREPGPHLKRAGEALVRVMRVLSDDCMYAIDTATTHAARRSYVRTMFAFVEGMTYALKQVALAHYLDGNVSLTPGELALLREETYELDEKGKVRTVTKFLRMGDNFRFTYHVYAATEGFTHELDVGGEGWAAFRKAVVVRNRLTHPKGPHDLVITEDDMNTVQTGVRWFQDQTLLLFSVEQAQRP